nr:unnamed protein product [Digitaria exilis]CAB3449625.1 unnamed protein product [Digitaria exilis]CAB3503329.1 unnamed protein product [Digitaria exilis]
METETKRLRTLPTPAAAAAAENAAVVVALVLGNIDILREILLLLDAPSHLVRAALVSKDWLRAAADPSFLRRFRARSPPRLLGFLASFASPPTNPPVEGAAFTRFVPLPHPPELDVAARLVDAAFNGGAGGQTKGLVVGCRNGRVLVKHGGYYGKRYSVRTPLRPSSAVGPTTVARPSVVPPQRVRDLMEPDVRCAQLELLPYPGVDDRRDALSGFGDLTNCSTDRRCISGREVDGLPTSRLPCTFPFQSMTTKNPTACWWGEGGYA